MLTHKGETLSVADWSLRIGINEKTIHMRLKAGWSTERTLDRPLQHGFMSKEPGQRRDCKADRERAEEKRNIREWLRTTSSDVEERREEGDIL